MCRVLKQIHPIDESKAPELGFELPCPVCSAELAKTESIWRCTQCQRTFVLEEADNGRTTV